MMAPARRSGTLWRGWLVLPLALCGGQALANCNVVNLPASGDKDLLDKVWTNFTFNPGTTSGSLAQKLRSLSGDSCNQPSYLFALPTSTNSQAGNGIATRAGGAETLSYQLLQSLPGVAWGNTTGNGTCNCITAPANTPSLGSFYLSPSGTATPPAGTYRDLVTVSRRPQDTSSSTAGAIQVTVEIEVPPHCALASSIADVKLDYKAFDTGAVSNAVAFDVACNVTPAGTTLEPSGGTLLGVPYTLALTGTPLGPQVNHLSIQATVTGSHAGTFVAANCLNYSTTGKCSATNVHTFTVTY